MFHHVSLGSNDLERSAAFYDPVLAAIGYYQIKRSDRVLAYGVNEVTFTLERPIDGNPATAGNGSHIAFLAGDRAMVDEFHRIALAQGGRDEGAPGLRGYDPNYYAAFVHDPDGNKIEVVTFAGK
jgi:catechol 2,3-dioxygenase-like lactoylglutathione lyase family enzyme